MMKNVLAVQICLYNTGAFIYWLLDSPLAYKIRSMGIMKPLLGQRPLGPYDI